MQAVLEINKVKDIVNNLNITKDMQVELNKNKRGIQKVVYNVVNRGADYVIKAMPVNDSVKDILIDVRKSLETKDFKSILKTVVDSSVREGLELLNTPKNVISDINKVKNIALKGGLKEGISAAIDIVTNKYLKGNIFASIIKDFINKTKDFIFSKKFREKLDKGIDNLLNKVEEYKDKCKSWYESYDKLDIAKMNEIASSLKKERRNVTISSECSKQNNVIQNMMELVNTKKDKLSNLQLQICNNL